MTELTFLGEIMGEKVGERRIFAELFTLAFTLNVRDRSFFLGLADL